ncbi:ABC transporter substrate-binding protein [Cupriavidus taiwanensis]|uniref:ABC transporter substrate-binding protein n=1 Tax=Cupriavidus taiwanensis TaxID=164546 RepID=A0A375CR73_9BURK|nr:tripartite tricarboxylate transporter substrate binding protein [Cupriavidus taiwanensis]SOY77939.1 ABC transporter substrate-binding protein [Cupriavidus taiwanensis]
MPNRPVNLGVRRVVVAAAMAVTMPAAMAWTNKPVRVLVPAPAGGTMDVVARLLSDQLTADLGQPVIVDNKPGAGGSIAIGALLAAPADGQTILVSANNILAEIPHVMKVPYDPMNDVKPVAAVVKASVVLVSAPSLPAKDFKGLVSYVKAHPGNLSFASYGLGTASQYAGMIMNQKAGMDLQHVPFSGSPPALTQVMGGQIAVMYDGMVTSLPYIKAGKLRAYAVAAKQRSSMLPQVPTFAELGYPEIDFTNWTGVFVSSKVSADLTEKIQAAVYKAALKPALRERIAALGFEPVQPQTVRLLGPDLRADFERNAGIVKTFHIEP